MDDDVVISVGEEPVEPHNITRLEVSPNGKYIVTHSDDDNSIIGWDASGIDEGRLKPEIVVKPEIADELAKKENEKFRESFKLVQMSVSDDKKLVCIYFYGHRNYLSK